MGNRLLDINQRLNKLETRDKAVLDAIYSGLTVYHIKNNVTQRVTSIKNYRSLKLSDSELFKAW